MELEAIGAEELDTVVSVGVVGGGDDDAGLHPPLVGEEGDTGGGDHPQVMGVYTCGQQPRRQCTLQHRAGEPGVLPDHHPRA